MINLLPPELKQDYTYARRNTVLRKYLIMIACGLVGLVIVTAAGTLYIRQAAGTYVAQSAAIEQSLKEQKQPEIEAEIKDISSSLKLAVQVLSKEVLFSKLLNQFATTIPGNATLSSLSINQSEKSVDITARTTDYNAATQLQINLQDPKNKIFVKADISNVSCATVGTGQTTSRYPCTVVIRALFAENNPFLFINDKAKG